MISRGSGAYTRPQREWEGTEREKGRGERKGKREIENIRYTRARTHTHTHTHTQILGRGAMQVVNREVPVEKVVEKVRTSPGPLDALLGE